VVEGGKDNNKRIHNDVYIVSLTLVYGSLYSAIILTDVYVPLSCSLHSVLKLCLQQTQNVHDFVSTIEEIHT
jgi:hypothetical protein